MTIRWWFWFCGFTLHKLLQKLYIVTVLSYIGIVIYWLCHIGSSPIIFGICYSFFVNVLWFVT
jgi:hypothetical protein